MRYIFLAVMVVFCAPAASAPAAFAVGQSGSSVVERPEVVAIATPAYPVRAVVERISGVVLVDVQINAAGKVVEATPIIGHEALRQASKKAALLWRFKPLKDEERPRYVRLTFIFHDPSYVAPEGKPVATCQYQVEVERIVAVGRFNR